MTDAAKGTTGPDAAPPNGAREPNDTIRTIPPEPRGPGRRAPDRAPLSLEAVGAIMAAAADDDRDYAAIGLMHFTHLRAGEVMAARVGDVIDTYDMGCLAIEVAPGKNMRPRVVGLSVEVAPAVTRCLRARQLEGAGPDDPLFTGRKGGPLSRDELVGIMEKCVGEVWERSPELLAGARVTPMELRRTGVMRALMDVAGPMSGYRYACERKRREDVSCYHCSAIGCRASMEASLLAILDPRREFS